MVIYEGENHLEPVILIILDGPQMSLCIIEKE